MQFEVKTDVFKGPLDILLDLIEKRKLLINEISLAAVTDDYIAFVRSQPELPMEESAHFILIASTLLLIKSKSLLPTLELSNEEQSNVEELERRLKMYQRIRTLSAGIANIYGKNPIYEAAERKKSFVVFSPDASMTVPNFLQSLRNLLKNMPKVEALPKAIVQKVMSLEEMMSNLTKRVQSSIRTSFRDFSGFGKREKVHVIVSFLAVLELVKQGLVNVIQNERHHDIEIESESVGLPNYG